MKNQPLADVIAQRSAALDADVTPKTRHFTRRLVVNCALWCVFGVALGMFGMTYHDVRPQPVVVEREIVKDCPVGQPAELLSPQGKAALVKLTTVSRAMGAQLDHYYSERAAK